MYKQGVICVCDSCGSQEVAFEIDSPYGNGEKDYTTPVSWISGVNPEVHFCPDCAMKLRGEKYNAELEF